jgi:hypothetical protein
VRSLKILLPAEVPRYGGRLRVNDVVDRGELYDDSALSYNPSIPGGVRSGTNLVGGPSRSIPCPTATPESYTCGAAGFHLGVGATPFCPIRENRKEMSSSGPVDLLCQDVETLTFNTDVISDEHMWRSHSPRGKVRASAAVSGRGHGADRAPRH